MKKILKIAVVVLALVFTVMPDLIYGQGIRRRTRRRTAVVVGSTAKAAGASQAAAAQQQTAAAQQQTAAANQQAAAAEQEAAAARQELVGAGLLPLGTVVHTRPAGCVTTTIGGVEYYHCGVNYYRAVFEGNNLVYVTAKPNQ